MFNVTSFAPAGDGVGRADEASSILATQDPFWVGIVGPSTVSDPAWLAPVGDGNALRDVVASSVISSADDHPDAGHDLSRPDASVATGSLPESPLSEIEDDPNEFFPTVYEAPDDPHRLARDVLPWLPHEEVPSLAFYRGQFYVFDGKSYRPNPEFASGWLVKHVKESLDREYQKDLHDRREVARQTALTGEGTGLIRLKPVTRVSKRLIGDVAQALGSIVGLDGETDPPIWRKPTDGDPAPLDIMVAANGLVDLGSHPPILRPHTPRFFSTCGLPYSYNPDAPAPETWLRFLRDLWPEDPESINTLHEIMGYLLTPDTRYHKMFLMIGPPRSGRSTIRDVITALIGERNVASTSAIALDDSFGLEPLLGKNLAIMADARISENSSVAIDRLLRIVGEDPVEVNRKNRAILSNVRMRTRFILVSNELPNLRDASNAITSRYLILRTTLIIPPERRDPDLKAKLLAELPGILNLAIEGRRRLYERRQFLQPASATDLLSDAEDLASPVAECVKECFTLCDELFMKKSDAFDIWKAWADRHGHHVGDSATFGKNLKAALPQIRSERRRINGKPITIYAGIGPRNEPTSEAASRATSP